jgi:hypothetical protein
VLIQIEYHIAAGESCRFPARAAQGRARAAAQRRGELARVPRHSAWKVVSSSASCSIRGRNTSGLRTRSTISDREIYDRVEALQRSDQPIQRRRDSSASATATSGERAPDRAIPSTGEALPVIGLGTWQTFDIAMIRGCARRAGPC